MSDPIGTGPLRPQLGRRQFIAALMGALLAAPLATEAQQPGKVYRIGILRAGPSPSPTQIAGGKAEITDRAAVERTRVVQPHARVSRQVSRTAQTGHSSSE